MTYELRFKPRAAKDLKIEEALADYQDLQELRDAKAAEADAPTVGLGELRSELGIDG